MLTAVLNVEYDWPIGAAVVVVLACGVVIGAVNAFFVVRIGVHSFVVTLGTGTLLLGATLGISDSQTIGGVASTLVDGVRERVFLGLPLVFYYSVGLTCIVWYLFSHTPLGRVLVFVGQGREVARLAGIRVNVVRSGALIASASVAALAGLCLAGLLGAADPRTGTTFLLPAFAGAFLGSTAVQPDRFNPMGTFIAVYFLVTGITGLQLLGYAGWVEQVFYGGSLVMAVTFSRLVSRRTGVAV